MAVHGEFDFLESLAFFDFVESLAFFDFGGEAANGRTIALFGYCLFNCWRQVLSFDFSLLGKNRNCRHCDYQ
jgi:hypothetical protein